ncbi:MAG: HEAT repeat domain-containing protein [Planctomycetota bacterium]|nr:MAG: HEAT repeat domain-containing protein [Planctomycetota bacterium]
MPPARLDWLPPDTTEWIYWWRWQRWQRLPPAPLVEPARPITPGAETGAEVARGQPAPAAAPRPSAAALAVPALLRLWSEPDTEPEVRAALLLSLGRCGSGPEVDDVLRDGLRDPDRRVVQSAVLALGALRQPHALELLAGLVEDSTSGRKELGAHEVPTPVRAAAAYALGLLAEDLPYTELRASIAGALLAGLQADAAAGDEIGSACALALGLFPGADAEVLLPELLALLRDQRRLERVRAAAPIALAKVGARAGPGMEDLQRRVFDELRRRLLQGSESALVRQSCALGTGRLGTLAGFAELAAQALLRAHAEDADPRVRQLAGLGLAEIAASPHPVGQTLVLPALLDGLEQGTTAERAWNAVALGWACARAQEQGRALPQVLGRRLQEALPGASDTSLRAAMHLALGLAGQRTAAAGLLAELQRIGDPVLRAEALAGSALLGDAGFLETALDELEATDPLTEPFQVAAAALAHQHPRALLERLQRPLESAAPPLQARLAAAVGFGWIRDASAVALLLPLTEAQQPLAVRSAAAAAIGRAAERGERLWNAGYLDLLQPYAGTPALLGDFSGPGVVDRW